MGYIDPYPQFQAPAPTGGMAPAPGGYIDPYGPAQVAAAPPAPPTSAFRELGTGLARAVSVGLPTTVGKGLQFAGSELGMPGVADTGAGMVQSADVRGQAPEMTLQPGGHSSVLNSVARVAAGSGAFLPGVAAAVIPGLQGVAPYLMYAGGLGAAAEAGENTREAVAQGSSPQDANRAGLIDAAQSAAFNLIGSKLFGGLVAGATNPLVAAARGMIGQEAPGLVGSLMTDLGGTGGAILPVLKQLPMTAAETVGIIGGQNAVSAAIQQHYGVQGGPTPGEAFTGSIGDAITTAGLFSGVAMRGRASVNGEAQQRTAILAHQDTDPATRTALADQYATALGVSGTPEAKAAATAFRENAQVAIDNKMALPVNSGLFTKGAIEAPPGPQTPATAAVGQTGDLFGAAPTGPIVPPGEPPLAPDIPQRGQEDMFKDSYEQQQTRAAAVDAFAKSTNPGAGMSAQDFINHVTGADTPGLTVQQVAKRQADARAAINEPSGVRANDPDTGQERELTMGELFDRRVEAAQPPAEPEAPRAPDETKNPAEIASDLSVSNAAQGFSDRPQDNKRANDQIKDLGLDALPDHPAQIKALDDRLADPDAKIGSATREKMQALSNKWHAELDAATPKEAAAPHVPDNTSVEPKAGDSMVWSNADTDVPVTFRAGATEVGSDGRRYAKVDRGGQESYVPLDELRPAGQKAEAAPAAPAEAAEPALTPDQVKTAAAEPYKASDAAAIQDAGLTEHEHGQIRQGKRDDTLWKAREGYAWVGGDFRPVTTADVTQARQTAQAEHAKGDALTAKINAAEKTGGQLSFMPSDWGSPNDTGSIYDAARNFARQAYGGSADRRAGQLERQRARTDTQPADARAVTEDIPGNLDVKSTAQQTAGVSARQRLLAVAERLGVKTELTNGGYHAADGLISIPAEDAQVEGALHPDDVFAHELGHAVMQKRGMHFAGFPDAEMRKWIPNWDEWKQAAKDFAPDKFSHPSDKIRRYARKPNEVIADAIGSVLTGKSPESLVVGKVAGLTRRDLGLPDTTGFETGLQPADAHAVTESIPGNLDVKSTAGKVADATARLGTTIRDLQGRQQGGETLPPLEAMRLKDAQDLSANLVASLKPGNRNGPDYIDSLIATAKDTDQPYTQKYVDNMRLRGSPDTPDPAIGAAIDQSNKLSDTLGHIAANSTDPANRALATRYAEQLAKMGSDPTVARGPGDPNDPLKKAGYSRSANAVTIHPGGETEHAVLHEAGHAAQSAAIDYAASIDKPRNQAEALLKQGYAEVDAVRQKALGVTSVAEQYGLTDMHEFMTEANSNPDFQSFLRRQGTQKSLWNRMLDGVRKLLGMRVDERTALDKSMTLNDALFGADHEATDRFMASTAGAARAVDDTMQLRVKDAENWIKSVDARGLLSRLGRTGFKEWQAWTTQDFSIARTHTNPEMVRSGFAASADAVRAARDSQARAVEYLDGMHGGYADSVRKLYAGTDHDKAVALDHQIGRMGTASSVFGTDIRKNAADNRKAGRAVDPIDEHAVNELHREFTQLQRTNPDAARALEQGELAYRKMLLTEKAPALKTLIEARAGISARLATELQAMTPEVAQAAQDQVSAIAAELAAMPVEDTSVRAQVQRAQLNAQLQTAQAQTKEGRIAAAQSEVDFAAKHAAGLDFMRDDIRKTTTRNPDPKLHYDAGAAVLKGRIESMFEDARTQLPAGSPLRDHLAELEKGYKAQMRNPYFSLGRTGNFFVSMKFQNVDAAAQARIEAALHGTNKGVGNLQNPENSRAFFRVETPDQAEGLHAKLLAAAGADHIVSGSDASGALADKGMVSARGVSPALSAMLGDIDTMVDHSPNLSPEQGQQIKAALQRSMLSLLPETSGRSARMERRNVAGYETDFLKHFVQRASGSVQDTGIMYGAPAHAAAFKQVADAVTRMNTGTQYSMANRVRAQDVATELKTRYANSMKPNDAGISRAVNTLNGFSSPFYLMLSPAYLIRTSAQPWLRGLPALTARYRVADSVRELGRAQADVSKIFYHTFKDGYQEGGMRQVLNLQMKTAGLSEADQQLMMEMHDRGKLNLGMTSQLQAANPSGSEAMKHLARMAGLTAQVAEMHGRASMALAAFRLAEKGRPGVDQQGRMANIDYAQNMTLNSMDDFAANNTARRTGKFGFAGPVTPLLTAFMQYNLQATQNIVRTVQDGFGNRGANADTSPAGLQRSKEARREFAGLMATTSMAAGVLGLPFANAFAGAYNTLTKDDDDPSDSRIDVRNFLANALGQQGGEIASHGIGGLLNIDSSSFGMEDLAPGSQFIAERGLLKDKIEAQSQQLLGPALNAGIGVFTGLAKISDGYWLKGIEAMLPSGLKAPYKAVELANRGYTDAKGNAIDVGDTRAGQPVNTGDIVKQAFGFRTADKASTDEWRGYAATNETLLAHRSQVLVDHFYKASQPGHEDELPEVQQEMAAFGAAHPGLSIRGPAIAGMFRRQAQQNALGNINKKFLTTLGPQRGFLGGSTNAGGMPTGQ